MSRPFLALAALVGLCSWLLAGTGGRATPAWAAPPDTMVSAGRRASARTPLQSLVAAEKTFAALAASRGTRTAFLANLGRECVIFRPLPENGLKHWNARTESKGRLLWGSAYAEIAGSGDFGVTTGPWEYHPPAGADSATVGYGQFLSVWTREGRSPWKVVLDTGISHPQPAVGLGQTEMAFGPEHAAAKTEGSVPSAPMVMTLDRSLTYMAAALGPDGVGQRLAADARYLRDGQVPLLGKAAHDSLVGTVRHTAWRPTSSGIARSGDLGYTYGVREDSSAVSWQTPDSTVYVHLWRRSDDGGWKLAAIVENPLKRGQR